MDDTNPLDLLRTQLSRPDDSFLDPSLYETLSVVEAAGVLHVDFYGLPFNKPYVDLCRAVSSPDVARRLGSLTLRCPDEGANGTCNWDLNPLVDSDVSFPELRFVSIEQNGPDDHNRRVVAADYDEEGILARLLQKTPALDSLISPSAPDASFFSAVQGHPLRYLNVDAGYDTQDFVANLASSTAFPNLQALEFGEYNETYLEDFPQGCTSFADYRHLFLSAAFGKVRTFTWRNPVCTPAEVMELRSFRAPRDLQFKIVRFSAEYVANR